MSCPDLKVHFSLVFGRSEATIERVVDKWHDYLSSANPTVADAILDRLTSGALRLSMRGESMRKLRAREIESV